MKERVRFYKSFDDDFHQVGADCKLPDDYEWIQRGRLFKCLSSLIYSVALVVSSVLCKLFFKVRFYGKEKLKRVDGGCFIYANHTNALGDVFHPALLCFPKRIYTVVDPLNLHLFIIGKLLKHLGALPIPNTINGIKNFSSAIEERYNEGNAIVIYPEAHLWDYYTGIRPFSDTSFRYPAKLSAPVFSVTTTYQKRKFFKRPKVSVYIDGPFYADGTVREKCEKLHQQVYESMLHNSNKNTCEYIKYLKEMPDR